MGTSRVQGTSPSMMEGRGEADPEEEAGGRWRHGDGGKTSVETCLRTAAWEWILVAARNPAPPHDSLNDNMSGVCACVLATFLCQRF